MEKGKAGESYILANEIVTYPEFAALTAQEGHCKKPLFYLPKGIANLAADILEESGVEKVDEERLRGEHDAFMVTTRDIDQQVRDLSKVVGYGINWALQDLEIEEMNALLS